jgi:hypothetical protein
MRSSFSSAGRLPELVPARWQRWRTAAGANPAALLRARLLPLVAVGLAALMLVLTVVWFRQVAAPVDCRAARLPLRLNSQADAAMTVARGSPCALVIESGPASVDALSVTTAPANGTVSPRGRTGVIYRAARGFAGDDAFSIALQGHVHGTVGTMQVNVRVAVK